MVEGGQLTLNSTETGELITSFQSHYSVSGLSSALQNELEFSWTEFRNRALDGVTASQAIISLIHRYDPENGNWYLTCGKYTFGGYAGAGNYSINGHSGLFDMNADGSMTNYSGGLQSTGVNYYDPEYFNNVLYDNAPLELNTNVRSVRFAWEELKQLHCDNKNNISGANDSLFKIRFCSIAPDCTSDQTYASVHYPHTIAVYMVYDGNVLLSDVVGNALFIDKAADFSSPCPPSCPVIIWPNGFAPKNC